MQNKKYIIWKHIMRYVFFNYFLRQAYVCLVEYLFRQIFIRMFLIKHNFETGNSKEGRD